MDRKKINSDESLRAKRNASQARHREKRKREDPDAYRENNRQQCRATYWRNAEKAREYSKKWREENREFKRYQNSIRKKYIKLATPNWADMNAIKKIYLDCPKDMHVDHIIPLRGRAVCGLNVENNLQYLTPLENIKKFNHFVDS